MAPIRIVDIKLFQGSGSNIQIVGGRKRDEAGSNLEDPQSWCVLCQIAARRMGSDKSDNFFFM